MRGTGLRRERSVSPRRALSWVVAVSLVAVNTMVVAPSMAVAAGGDADPTFGGDGTTMIELSDAGGGIETIVSADGSILVGGADSGGFAVARLSASGVQDLSYGDGGGLAAATFSQPVGELKALLPAADGDVIAVGAGYAGIVLARFTGSGALDAAFGGGDGGVEHIDPSNGGFGSETFRVLDAAMVSGDGIMVVGESFHPFPSAQFARLTADGELDPAFGDGGWVVTPHPVPSGEDVEFFSGDVLATGETVLVGAVGSTRRCMLPASPPAAHPIPPLVAALVTRCFPRSPSTSSVNRMPSMYRRTGTSSSRSTT